MIRIEMKHCNMILPEKQQKHQLYYKVKLINMIQMKKRYLLIQEKL